MKAGVYRAGNYWRKARAERAGFLVDAAEYFDVLTTCLEQAEHSIFIVGWNISAKVVLRQQPRELFLSDFLYELVERRPELNVYLMGWNFPFLFMPGRDLPPALNLAWKEHPRIHHRIDDFHPIGACHHQKLVVIDDNLAFSGGLDVCEWRWDTPEHRPEDPRRQDSDGDPYEPFHDVQMIVQGPIAQTMGEIVRRRWKISFPEIPLAPAVDRELNWPAQLPVQVPPVDIALSLTYPYFGGQKEQREIEAISVDAIHRAERFVYLENQYLTSTAMGEALRQSLLQPEGPEVIVVLSEKPSGWLEWNTMGALQDRLMKKLKKADRYRRLGYFYPAIPNLRHERLTVHSKVMIIDDDFIKVGSANFNNRSMGFDTECDLSFCAEDRPELSRSIQNFRHRLFAEHLGLEENVGALETQFPSILDFIRSRMQFPRCLRPIVARPPWYVFPFARAGSFDPPTPMVRERLLSDFLQDDQRSYPQHRPRSYPLFFFVFCLALAALWFWRAPYTLESRHWDREEILFYNAVLFGCGALLLFPPVLLCFTAFLFWGPERAFAWAWGGAVLTCLLQYGMGMLIPKERIRGHIRKWRILFFQQIGRLRTLPNFVLRGMAVAPLMTLNLVAGAAHSSLGKFFFFSIFGSFPLLITLFAFTTLCDFLGRNIASQFVGALFAALALLSAYFLFRKKEPAWIRTRGARR